MEIAREGGGMKGIECGCGREYLKIYISGVFNLPATKTKLSLI